MTEGEADRAASVNRAGDERPGGIGNDTPIADPGKRRGADWVGWLARLGPLIGLLFAAGLFALLRPRSFLTVDNLELILLQTAVVGTASLGMTLIIVSGGIDLSLESR